MKFFDWLSTVVMTPIESITDWLNELDGVVNEWFGMILRRLLNNTVLFFIEGIACFVICYSIYCSCRVMGCGGNDEKFSEYTNKTMVACVCYFFAKYGGVLISHYLVTVGV